METQDMTFLVNRTSQVNILGKGIQDKVAPYPIQWPCGEDHGTEGHGRTLMNGTEVRMTMLKEKKVFKAPRNHKKLGGGNFFLITLKGSSFCHNLSLNSWIPDPCQNNSLMFKVIKLPRSPNILLILYENPSHKEDDEATCFQVWPSLSLLSLSNRSSLPVLGRYYPLYPQG